jgi:hypothetical protein
VIEADGSSAIKLFVPDPEPAFDCFYVYPKTSRDKSGYSDMLPDQSEFRTTESQFARFREVCRTFAPV